MVRFLKSVDDVSEQVIVQQGVAQRLGRRMHRRHRELAEPPLRRRMLFASR